MDATISPVSGTSQPYTPPAIKAQSDFVPVSTPHPAPPVKAAPAPQAKSGSDSDDQIQYQAALRQAAISFKDVYALGDHDFTIFKDSTGKYITRYVSLRDGKVTYIPEPTLVKLLQISGGNTPHLAISA